MTTIHPVMTDHGDLGLVSSCMWRRDLPDTLVVKPTRKGTVFLEYSSGVPRILGVSDITMHQLAMNAAFSSPVKIGWWSADDGFKKIGVLNLSNIEPAPSEAAEHEPIPMFM